MHSDRAIRGFRFINKRLEGRTAVEHVPRDQQADTGRPAWKKVHIIRRRRRCFVDREHEFGHGRQQTVDVGQRRTYQTVAALRVIVRSNPNAMRRMTLTAFNSVIFSKVGNLRYASPATVSRAGMVYVDPKNLGYIPYWSRFLLRIKKSDREPLNALFQKYVPTLLDRIFDGNYGFEKLAPLKMIIPQTKLNLVRNGCLHRTDNAIST